MFKLLYVYQLKRKYSDRVVCDDLSSSIINELYKGNIAILKHKLSDSPIEAIKISLRNNSVCFIRLSNPKCNTLFGHYFVLFNTEEGVVRIESYHDSRNIIYCPRIVEWPTYLEDISRLLNFNPGSERLAYYNGLFNAEEQLDSESNISIDINLVSY